MRELAHELERAIVFEDGNELNFAHFGTTGDAQGTATSLPWLNTGFRFPEEGFDLEEAIRQLIDRALQQTGNNVSAAARLLGVTRDYLRYRLTGQKTEESAIGEGDQSDKSGMIQ